MQCSPTSPNFPLSDMSRFTKGQVDPLSSLTRLSPSVYVYDPINTAVVYHDSTTVRQEITASKETITTSSSAAPKIVVLFTWMSAHSVHIVKYLSGYQVLYPTSRILIIRSSPADFIWRSANSQRRRADPAVSAILSHCTVDEDSDPEILLHLFSNGGSSQLLPLLDAYRAQISISFPAHVKILDSCPGRGTFKESIHALSASFPKSQPLRILLLGLLYLLMSVYFIILATCGITNPIERIRQALNGTASWKNEKGRCYIYGDADKMVRWCDVEDHAEEARQKGLAVRTEKFGGSGHVAHVREGDGARYWRIVDEMWRGRQGEFEKSWSLVNSL